MPWSMTTTLDADGEPTRTEDKDTDTERILQVRQGRRARAEFIRRKPDEGTRP